VETDVREIVSLRLVRCVTGAWSERKSRRRKRRTWRRRAPLR
jgi:hypothetical protein